MYIPSAFARNDLETLHAFMEQDSFATLVNISGGEPSASHLPLLLDRDVGSHGRLVGHMARANPQWRQADGQRVLAVFHGPHAYISPTWYAVENTVPTWNYVAVHACGTFRLDDDRDRRLEIVRRYVEAYEADLDPSWSLDQAEAGFIDQLLDAIVGFHIDIDHLEGKWKLNQNHDAARRERVVRALRAAGGEDQLRIAELMSEA